VWCHPPPFLSIPYFCIAIFLLFVPRILHISFPLISVTVWFGSVFGQKKFKPMKSSPVWFGFYYFSKNKPNQTSWFGSVCIGLVDRFA